LKTTVSKKAYQFTLGNSLALISIHFYEPDEVNRVKSNINLTPEFHRSRESGIGYYFLYLEGILPIRIAKESFIRKLFLIKK